MKEKSLLDRIVMVLGVLASIVMWVVQILYKMVHNLFSGNSESTTIAPASTDIDEALDDTRGAYRDVNDKVAND